MHSFFRNIVILPVMHLSYLSRNNDYHSFSITQWLMYSQNMLQQLYLLHKLNIEAEAIRSIVVAAFSNFEMTVIESNK
jgi:hypothetical protein